MPHHVNGQRAVVVAILAVTAVAIAACGSSATTLAATSPTSAARLSFCDAYVAFHQANDNMLAAKSAGRDDFHVVAVHLRAIAESAPASIQADANTAAEHAAKVDETTAKVGGDLSKVDPGVMATLLTDPTAQAATDRLNRYAEAVCGLAGSTSTVGR
jgi:hypothetical protein